MTFQPKTIPLVGYPKVVPYTKFEHFVSFAFELSADSSVKNALIDPVTLTFQPQHYNTSGISQGHSRTKFEYFHLSSLNYTADKQTEGLEHPAHADSVRRTPPTYRALVLI